jgi:hypothetical protein
MHLSEIEKNYDIGFRHNPSHFYPNSFQVEHQERRLVLVAVVKRHIKKRYRIVGVLKAKQ